MMTKLTIYMCHQTVMYETLQWKTYIDGYIFGNQKGPLLQFKHFETFRPTFLELIHIAMSNSEVSVHDYDFVNKTYAMID